ncbi:alanine racemase [Embleya sp. NPDC055664]
MTAIPRRERVASLAAARLEKTVSADAVRHNLGVLRAAAGGRRVMAVVKGDAYGFGAPDLARLLVDARVDALAVDTVAQGAELREVGIEVPILVMDVDVADNAAACARHRLMPAVATAEQVRRHGAVLRDRGGAPGTVWLRTNVGFNRFGPREDEGFGAVLDALHEARDAVRPAGVFAHLSSAGRDEGETAAQADAFRARLASTRAVLGPRVVASLAATHGLLHPDALRGTDWVRPGLGLYGLLQADDRVRATPAGARLDGLRPAVSVRARVLDVVTVTRSEGFGYDRSASVAPGRRLGSVAIGFSHGLAGSAAAPRGLLRGRSCAMVGRPGMDCTQFDVTDVPGGARPGDWMTFIGPEHEGGGPARTARDLGAELGLSLYELLATLRMPVRVEDSRPRRDGIEAFED